MKKRVFISKNENETQELTTLLQKYETHLVSHSFLKFEQNEFEIDLTFDVIFFSSPRSFIFYKSRYEIPQNALIATTGNTTKELLESLDYSVGFSGVSSGKISTVAQDFKEWCGSKKVLFPISNISKKTVSSLFTENQKTEVIVYNTLVEASSIEKCDTYVFTSPSNVRGFLLKNEIPLNAQIISWGESTSNELKANNLSIHKELETASMNELTEVLFPK